MSRIGPRIRMATALAITVLAVAAIMAARFAWRTEPREAREARRALADGRYDDAGRALARWLQAVPDTPEAHVLRGRVAVAMSRLSEAADELAQAQSLGLPREELALLHALIASKAGRHAEAEPTLRRAFDLAGVPDRQVDEALAKTYLETYDLTRAKAVLDRWARDFPDDPKPYLWRADVDSRTATEQGAVELDYREALRRDPSLAAARLGVAEELRKAHRNGEAAAEYNAFLAVEPDNAVAHLGAGRNLMEMGDETAATGHLNRAMTLDGKNAEPLKEMAHAAMRRGDWTAAIAVLDRAVALDPFDVAVRQSRGVALMRLGRTEEARAEQATASRLRQELDKLHDARKRLIASPHDRKSQLEVAQWMFDHAQEHEGARWAEKILVEWPDDPQASRLLADYHQHRGANGLANFYRLRASTSAEPSSVTDKGKKP